MVVKRDGMPYDVDDEAVGDLGSRLGGGQCEPLRPGNRRCWVSCLHTCAETIMAAMFAAFAREAAHDESA